MQDRSAVAALDGLGGPAPQSEQAAAQGLLRIDQQHCLGVQRGAQHSIDPHPALPRYLAVAGGERPLIDTPEWSARWHGWQVLPPQ